MRQSLSGIWARWFGKAFAYDFMNFMLLGLAIVVPLMIAKVLWPGDPENGVMKVMAMFLGSMTFVALMGFHKYFGFLIAKLELETEERNEGK